MKRTTMTLMVAGLMLVAVGCEHRMTDFTIISTRNVDLSQMGTYKKGAERVRGRDKLYTILVFKQSGDLNLKEAIDDALNQVPGTVALLDGVIYTKNWYLFPLWGEDSLIIEGTPLIDPNVITIPPPPE